MEDGGGHLGSKINQCRLPADPRRKDDRSKPGAEAAGGQRSGWPLAREEPGHVVFAVDGRMGPALVDELENKVIRRFGQFKRKLLELQGDASLVLDHMRDRELADH
ncbi:hypothetical protein [Kitasatospora sp. NPDC058218]|uniref:hypothetical protein n=1 Tax=Kitasatospora sp. NPDC058218 TaxID=3346385 RepID=UPI0036DE14FE